MPYYKSRNIIKHVVLGVKKHSVMRILWNAYNNHINFENSRILHSKSTLDPLLYIIFGSMKYIEKRYIMAFMHQEVDSNKNVRTNLLFYKHQGTNTIPKDMVLYIRQNYRINHRLFCNYVFGESDARICGSCYEALNSMESIITCRIYEETQKRVTGCYYCYKTSEVTTFVNIRRKCARS